MKHRARPVVGLSTTTQFKNMKKEKTFEVSWAYGETTFINARDEAHARRVAVGMGRAMALGRVLWVLPAEVSTQEAT